MQTITSKEVAEMLDKRHDNLLRAIRKYIATLGEEAPKYFMEDPEKGGRMYLVTKAGCDLMANRIQLQKSVEFKAKYSDAFGEGTAVDPTPEPQNEENDFTVDEVAKLLGVSERSIYNWIKQGKLGSIQKEVMMPVTKTFVTAEDLEKIKQERGIQ